jgi:antitoxin ParD1/3/4
VEVTLSAELEDLVNERLASGKYASADDVITEALLLLRRRDAFPKAEETLRAEIQIGLDQLDSGRATVYDQGGLKALFDEIKAKGRENLTREAEPFR